MWQLLNLLQTLIVDPTVDELPSELVVKTLPQYLSMPSVTVLVMDVIAKVFPPGIYIKYQIYLYKYISTYL